MKIDGETIKEENREESEIIENENNESYKENGIINKFKNALARMKNILTGANKKTKLLPEKSEVSPLEVEKEDITSWDLRNYGTSKEEFNQKVNQVLYEYEEQSNAPKSEKKDQSHENR